MSTKDSLRRARACLDMDWKDDSIGPQEILDTMHARGFSVKCAVAKTVYYYIMLYYKELNFPTQKFLPSVAKDCIMAEYNAKEIRHEYQ